MNYNHVCTLEERKKDAIQNKKAIGYRMISVKNPRTAIYFRGMASIEKERFRQLRPKYAHVIHPLSMASFSWSIAYLLLVYISLLSVPISLIFGRSIVINGFHGFAEVTDKLFNMFCIADIFVTFFTGVCVPAKKQIILDRQRISKMYLQSLQFYIDCVTSLPHYLISDIVSLISSDLHTKTILNYWEHCVVIKLFRLRKWLRYYSDNLESFENNYYLRITIKYILLVVLGLHWATCIFLAASIWQIHYNPNTEIIVDKHLRTFVVSAYSMSMYCHCFYIVTSFMLSISLVTSYRTTYDYDLNSVLELVIFIIYSVLGFIACTYMLVLILQIVTANNAARTKYQAIMSQVRRYISHKDLPDHIRDRILNYYEFRYQKTFQREKKILNILSETLRKDIYHNSCRTLIERVTLLKDLPMDIISEVVSSLKYEVFLYNDLIVKAGTPGDCMYFIANGTVAVSTLTGKEICHLQDGAYFGEIALISKDQKRIANVVAIEICEVYRLDRKNFKMCFTLNSNHFKKIEQTARERIEKTSLLEELHKKYMLNRT